MCVRDISSDIVLLVLFLSLSHSIQRDVLYDVVEGAFSSASKWMMRVFKTSDEMFMTDNEEEEEDVNIVDEDGYILEPNGKSRVISQSDAQKLLELNNEWCMLGQRVLLVCK